MKNIFTFSLTLSFIFISHACLYPQQAPPVCGFSELYLQMLDEDPGLGDRQQIIEDHYLDFVNDPPASFKSPLGTTLPIVVHVVHLPGTAPGTDENITDAEVMEGLSRLNQTFAGIPCGGDPAGNDMGLQFELAKQDINGEPTTGILRHGSTYSEFGVGGYSFMILDVTDFGARFPTTDYINIYLVKSICYLIVNGECQGPLGLATSPASHGSIFDCVIVEAGIWAGDDACLSGKLSAHEMGHFFNLLHTFENGCPNDNCLTQGDRVCDTAPDNIQNRNSSPCINGQPNNSCSTDADDDYCNPLAVDEPDPEDNIMDYSPFECQYRFTEGQRTRMQAALNGTRASLLSSPGLEEPCLPVITVGITGSRNTTVDSLTTYQSETDNTDSLAWLVDGTYVSSSPTLMYAFPAPGEHQLSLQAFNSNGCIRAAEIQVNVYRTDCNIGLSAPMIPELCNSGFTFDRFITLEAYPSGGLWYDENGVIVAGTGILNRFYYSNYGPGTYKLYYIYREGECQETLETTVTISDDLLDVWFDGEIDCNDPQPGPIQLNISAENFGEWYDNQNGSGFFSNLFSTEEVQRAGTYDFEMFTSSGMCRMQAQAPSANEADIQIETCTECQNSIELCVAGAPAGAEFNWTGGYPILPGRWEVLAIADNGCESWDRIDVTSVANQNPVCNAGSSFSILCGQETTLGGAVSQGGEIEYWWTTPDGNILSGSRTLNPRINRPGIYILHVRNTLTGCGDTDTMTVTPLVKNTTVEQTICNGESFEGYDQSGIYIDTFTYACDCDSIRTLELTVLPEISTTDIQSICEGESYQGYTQSGTYAATYTDVNGCDSTYLLELTVHPPDTTTLSVSICGGENYEGYTDAGTYEDAYISYAGCDSTRILQLTILPNMAESISATICAGEDFEGYTLTGTYEDVFTAANGCDSTRLLELTVLPNDSTFIAATICQGENFLGYTQSGTYEDVLTASNGCDSIRRIELTVLPPDFTFIDATICQGESLLGYTQSGIYEDVFTAINGCDSIRRLELIVLSHDSTFIDATICQGESFEGYSQSGTYEDVFTATTGCDSTRLLDLTVLTNDSTFIEATICQGESFEGYTQSGIYENVFTATTGCDSIRLLNLTVLPEDSTFIDATICQGESFEGYSQSGTYEDVFTAVNGCDSTRILELLVSAATISYEVVPEDGSQNGRIQITDVNGGIPPYQFLWSTGDTTLTIDNLATGNYSLTITDANDCEMEFSFFVDMVFSTSSTDSPLRVRLFPNPAASGSAIKLVLQSPVIRQYRIRLYDPLGRMVSEYDHAHVASTTHLTFSVPTAGFYTVWVGDERSAGQVFKLLVK